MRRRPSPATSHFAPGVLLAILLLTTPAPAGAQTDAELAMHWAPVIFQDAVDTDGGRRDFMTAYDFDGNNDVTDNWENTTIMDGDEYRHSLSATVYYAVIESRTHYYISYFIYHPMDWQFPLGRGATELPPAIEHESDIEGVTMVINKEPPPFGEFRAMYTQAHGDFYYFTDDPGVEIVDRVEIPAIELVTGSLDHLDANFGDPNGHGSQPEDGHAYTITPAGRYAIFIETRGHGIGQLLRALRPTTPGIEIEGATYDFWGVDFDGVIYYPGDVAGEPTSQNDRSVSYSLEPFATTIWPERHAGDFFASFSDVSTYRGISLTGMGQVVRASGQEAGANGPWTWPPLTRCPEGECGNVNPGDPFLDPAQTVSQHLNFADEALDGFLIYERNIYLLGDNDLEILEPTAGDVWSAGDVVVINWRTIAPPDTSTGLAEQMAIELSRDDGVTWEMVAPSVARTLGNWPWQVTPPASDSCRIRLTAYSAAGGFLPLERSSERLRIEAPITIPPTAYALASIIPNPAIGSTVITMELPERATVELAIYDPHGRRVRLLSGDELQVGVYAMSWDGHDDAGDLVRAGTYFCRMTANDFSTMRQLVFEPAGRMSDTDPPVRSGDSNSWEVDPDHSSRVPGFGLVAITPNPAHDTATIIFELTDAAAPVSLRIYDPRGRLVRTLPTNRLPAGVQSVIWDSRDDGGEIVAQGVYFCRLQAGARTSSRKLLIYR